MAILRNVMRWFKKRFILVPKRDNRIGYGLIFIFWIVSSISATIHAIGNPTGATLLSHLGNIGKWIGLNSLLFLGATVLLGILFSLLYIPLPRLFLGSFVYVMFVNVAILLDASSGKLFSFVIGIGYSVAVLLVSLIIFALIRMKIGRIALLALLVMSGIFISVPLF
ncbi:MAG TPA: hypothetical protein VK142_08045, partial [Bacillota bacterium]|nr:hypothetical protein [Bacillota bacterium]